MTWMERSTSESKVTPLFSDKALLSLYFFRCDNGFVVKEKSLYLLTIQTEVFTDRMIEYLESV